MKRILSIMILAVVAVSFSSCQGISGSQGESDKGKLTNAKVQKALDKALAQVKQSGTVTVQGVRETPLDNSAKVTVQFDQFRYDSRPFGFGGVKEYTGIGSAVLSHYTDGRWVITTIHIPEFGSTPMDTNVEVE